MRRLFTAHSEIHRFKSPSSYLQTVDGKLQYISCSANGQEQHMLTFYQSQAVVWKRDCCPSVIDRALYSIEAVFVPFSHCPLSSLEKSYSPFYFFTSWIFFRIYIYKQ